MEKNDFSVGDKIIAINDSELCIPPLEFCLNINPGDEARAYSKGDIFIIRAIFSKDELVIWHDLLGSTMAVNSCNFLNLKSFRDNKIKKILNDTY